MPIKEYRCRDCGQHFEELVPTGDASLQKCPNCGSDASEMIYSPPAVRFNGQGFYSTDSKGDADEDNRC